MSTQKGRTGDDNAKANGTTWNAEAWECDRGLYTTGQLGTEDEQAHRVSGSTFWNSIIFPNSKPLASRLRPTARRCQSLSPPGTNLVATPIAMPTNGEHSFMATPANPPQALAAQPSNTNPAPYVLEKPSPARAHPRLRVESSAHNEAVPVSR
jgi:hypothetical protein